MGYVLVNQEIATRVEFCLFFAPLWAKCP